MERPRRRKALKSHHYRSPVLPVAKQINRLSPVSPCMANQLHTAPHYGIHHPLQQQKKQKRIATSLWTCAKSKQRRCVLRRSLKYVLAFYLAQKKKKKCPFNEEQPIQYVLPLSFGEVGHRGLAAKIPLCSISIAAMSLQFICKSE